MTSGDADENGESSPPTSMTTSSVAPLPAGADMALSGAASSDGAEVVRCEATCDDCARVGQDILGGFAMKQLD